MERGLGVGECGGIFTAQLLFDLVVICIIKEFGPRAFQCAALKAFPGALGLATETGVLEAFFRLTDPGFSDRPALRL